MAIYVFNLLAGYGLSGVDYAQGRRNSYFKKINQYPKYIFMDCPNKRDLKVYNDLGIPSDQIMSAHSFMCGIKSLEGDYEVEKKLEELSINLQYDKTIENEDSIFIYKNGKRIAVIVLKSDKRYLSEIRYHKNNQLVMSEYYTNCLLYRNYYYSDETDSMKIAKKYKRVFFDKNGTQIFECLYQKEDTELYIIPEEGIYDKYQFQQAFIKKLELSSEDIVIIDRPSYFDYVKPLFQYSNGAKKIVFMHSGHFYKIGEDFGSVGVNKEYYNWFRYSDMIDMILVSTEEQKCDLVEKLKEYECHVPRIEALPIGGIDRLHYAVNDRKKNSLLTVSRLAKGKRIEWIIFSVIEAHKIIPDVSLDVYGRGNEEYTEYLKKIVRENQAEEYITFKGHCDVTEVYKDYEIYISASTFETFGLSVLEAAGAGNAVIGLDVRYGNRLFVKNNQNGTLIDFSIEDIGNKVKVDLVISEMTRAIVNMIQDKDKICEYRSKSYEIAENFLNDKIEKRWMELFNSL